MGTFPIGITLRSQKISLFGLDFPGLNLGHPCGKRFRMLPRGKAFWNELAYPMRIQANLLQNFFSVANPPFGLLTPDEVTTFFFPAAEKGDSISPTLQGFDQLKNFQLP